MGQSSCASNPWLVRLVVVVGILIFIIVQLGQSLYEGCEVIEKSPVPIDLKILSVF